MKLPIALPRDVRQDRPSFHIAPPQGWVNGHAVSRDLVTWEHLPHAVVPTPGALDSDGAFSGCATLDEDGIPVILYTGVRLRSNDSCGPLPPTECDLGMPFIESQCAVRPVNPEDPKLTYWTKIEFPWLSLPPPSMNLAGWRDPYVISRPGKDGEDHWSLVIGSGVKEEGGVVLVYTSKELMSPDGWQLQGELCHGRGMSSSTGIMWECPILCKLEPLPTTPSKPDACTNPSYYWLGAYDASTKKFDLENAAGPFRLDLGDVLYAPNTLNDEKNGRTLLFGWNQEKRTKVDAYDYAGCLSLPRALWAEPSSGRSDDGASPSGWVLHQQPLPEISQLRDPRRSWRLQESLPAGATELIIDGGAKLPLPGVSSPFLDMELTFERAPVRDGDVAACSASGLLLHSWRGGAEGAAALLYHWDSGVLEVVYEALDPSTLTFSLAAHGARRVGGRLLRPPAPGSPLSLRVFLDYSCLEVFTAAGEVLTARVYRGSAPAAPACTRCSPAFGSSITADEEASAAEPLSLEPLSLEPLTLDILSPEPRAQFADSGAGGIVQAVGA
ncbi:hypothetical protein GPECTOR_19g349 [Gonium pectorale]|uniref:Glycosyl hydrolase family 32 N-terminal domain-containing protein n=1 Tax=Gonium pectorale TaxID=33097 RepID=A0A150GJB4_GONPE|nr:hypothetical protein GPECTOR_19g349 [Gonium pectorale]|eukprot:KXZ49898.1 hypothetical protein GPECTOR_19g349 [Gonium pectorale]